MRLAFIVTALLTVHSIGAAEAGYSSKGITLPTPEMTIAHGGGCRKNSPPGQCCHAGSQPYHCH